MAKKTEEAPAEGEQLDLIQTQPENAKAIQRAARAYKKIVRERLAIQVKEKALKAKLIETVREAHVNADGDGACQFSVGDITIKVTPRDELVQVIDKSDKDDGGDED